MSVLAQVQEEIKSALKAGDKRRVSALRMVLCELQNEAKRLRTELDEATEVAVLRRELKRREESLEAFRAGGRDDLAEYEEFAASLIRSLLPAQMDEAQLARLIDEVVKEVGAGSPKDMGKVMSAVMARGGGSVDGKLAAKLVKERLSA